MTTVPFAGPADSSWKPSEQERKDRFCSCRVFGPIHDDTKERQSH